MVVHYAEESLVDGGVILYFDPVLHSSKIVTQVDETSWLDARKYDFGSKS
jgi:hypothetical protein